MFEFVMPSLGADMERGVLVEWLVTVGQHVDRGDLVAVVETDKGAIEVEIWTPGTVAELVVPEGSDVPVGTVLARLSGASATADPAPSAPPAADAPPAEPSPEPAPTPVVAVPPHSGRASPWARHLAAERGVDLTGVVGTGPGGAIVGADVPQARTKPVAAGTDADAMRRAVARAMERSKREIPHYYLGTEVDLTPTLAWLERRNAAVPPPQRVLPAVLFLAAAARAVREVPQVNGFWKDGRLEVSEAVHLGVAISLRGGGLVAPAVRDADRLDLGGLMAALDDLVRRARRGRLRGSEMTDATLTTTSMGDRGVSDIQGVIYPPQVAIVGFGRVVERPWIVDGAILPRSVVRVTLAGDHRAHDGHTGGLYLSAVANLLTNPESLA
ncbi:MAG: 2-oxo acid dehydrogenase subunit E2 [Alphaproteobacteria bacterium]|nr:2-oxo acid dehydrogenase subunit E2 [Alphaproteobacteria bacterium]